MNPQSAAATPPEPARAPHHVEVSFLTAFPRSGANFVQNVLSSARGVVATDIYRADPWRPRLTDPGCSHLNLRSHACSPLLLGWEASQQLEKPLGNQGVVILVRDPRDSFISLYNFCRKQHNMQLSQVDFCHAYSFYDAAPIYARFDLSRPMEPLSLVDAYRMFVATWLRERQPLRRFLLRFEECTAHPAANFQALSGWLGIPPDSIDLQRVEQPVNQVSREANRPRGAAGGWRQVTDTYGPIIAEVERTLAPELELLGYT